MNYLSLFSGIGGLDLGLDRAGLTCVGQVESDRYCRRVLARHWPQVPRHDDVRTAPRWWAQTERPRVDLVAGGPPCQPHSTAGRRRGVGDPRWGWPWFVDVVDTVRPAWILVENVAGLLADAEAFGIILGGLSDRGFDAEWSIVSACSVGAPHVRRRLFVVAHAPSGRRDGRPLEQLWEQARRTQPARRDPWPAEPAVDRMAYGVPERVDRVKALANAVVPAVAEHIGRLILAADAVRR